MFLTIDHEKCLRDSLCILECPAKILELEEEGPVLVEGGEELCIRCGHCVAVCPEAALSIDDITPESCREIDRTLLPDEQQAELFLRSRRSIRTYRRQAMNRETLDKAITIASTAPTGSNKQPVEWLVFFEREDVKTIATHVIDWMRFVAQHSPEVAATYNMERIIKGWDQGVDRICRDAPHLLITHASKEFGIGGADCHTALAYLELILPSLGGGSCWAGYVMFAATQWQPLKEFINLPKDHLIHGAAMVGLPKFTYQRIPPRNQPKVSYR